MEAVKPDITVIIPVVERYDPVQELYEDYRQALRKTGRTYEFIYVLDGGFAALKEPLQQLRHAGEPITILSFAKWFGEATAITAGFEYAQGDHILILSSFHQIDADGIAGLIESLGDTDMVLARRDPRSRTIMRRLQTGVFHFLMRRITGIRFHDVGCDIRFFRRRVLEEINLYGDQHLFFPYLAFNQGFRITEAVVQSSKKRHFGPIHPLGLYVRKLIDVFSVFFVVKFTKKPLRFFGLIGVSMFGVGALFAAVLLVQRLVFSVALAQRPIVLIPALLLTLGVQIFAIGLIGEILIFTHARQLKEYTIEEVIN
jgi:glycosyltransferase involved in cell wall biosynthesis